MNSIIDAHYEFVENYNEDTSGIFGLLSNHRKVTKVNPHVALYCFPNFERTELSTEDRLLFLLQEKFGIKNTKLIKEIIPDIIHLTDPEYCEAGEDREQSIEHEPDKLTMGFLSFLDNMSNSLVNDRKIRWSEANYIKRDTK